MGDKTKTTENVLILNHHGIGDVLMSFPAIRWLATEINDNIYMTVRSSFVREMCNGELNIKEYFIICFRKQSYFKILQTIFKIRLMNINTVIGLYGYRCKDVRRFAGVINANRWICNEVNEKEELSRNTSHKVDQHLKIISRFLSKKVTHDLGNQYLFREKSTSSKYNILPYHDYIVFIPGSGEIEPYKRWPTTEFANFANYLLKTNPNLNILITGSSMEGYLAKQIRHSVKSSRVFDLTGQLSIDQLKSTFKYSKFVIGGDSGGMHFAKACGAKIVVLMGPTNSALTSPINSDIIIDLNLPGTPWYCRKNYKKYAYKRDEPSMKIPSSLVINKLEQSGLL